MSSATGESGDLTAAQLRVVRGEPDDVELAALVAGIVAARVAAADDDAPSRPAPAPWSDHGRRLGRPPVAGPGAWRWSLHP
ncbi:Acyl-CoA carboxylase epsilon subunit [Georgenia satyanarayanai]|uniref:Acyl-CoA carboxylase epsilon subunit n=1 Tax=Georgenia satyanarayanai TaxID=860221 RepID=A0A2Y9APQ6_9MICO|nr:acyl-CoA carboxylase subunit epsilon [Georgenia satyanarayanai]PYF96788.1 acyl-CoA carboxylase epsilon subunit-like protein [Georgenia satyanarayanai]SSA46384.1 Acyl-CoA carboxylase epsilon subunit [Georgenia satyanarayanai]